MEKYLTAAEKISRAAIFGNEPMQPTLVSLRSGQRNQKPQMTPLTDYDLTGLSMANAFHTTYRFPVAGEYVLRINLGGDRPPGSEALQLALWIDGVQNHQLTVDPATIASFASASEPQQLWGVAQSMRAFQPRAPVIVVRNEPGSPLVISAERQLPKTEGAPWRLSGAPVGYSTAGFSNHNLSQLLG